MKLLILCAVLSVILAVSFASPVKTHIREVIDSSESSESSQLKDNKNNLSSFSSSSSSSSEEEEDGQERQQVKVQENEIKATVESSSSSSSSEDDKQERQQVQENKIEDTNEEDTSINSSEERSNKYSIAKDEVIEISNSLEEEAEKPKEPIIGVLFDDNEILDNEELRDRRSKRAVEFAASTSNQLINVKKEENSVKHQKYSILKRLDSNRQRFERSVESSEENSSEEDDKDKNQVAQETSGTAGIKSAAAPGDAVVLNKTKDIVAAAGEHAVKESEPKPAEEHTEASKAARRRRNLDVFSGEDDQFKQEQDLNEVFIFSDEKKQVSEDDFKNDSLKDHEQTVLNENFLDKSEKTEESKDSEEDYAQGCLSWQQ